MGISVYDRGGGGGGQNCHSVAHHRGHLFKGDRGESSPQMRLCIAIFGTTYFIGSLLLPFQVVSDLM